MLRFLTAGESHAEALTAIIEGFPKGVTIDKAFVDGELARRQGGFGRGGRMAIEKDTAHFLCGLRAGKTLGSPIAFTIKNKDKTIDCFEKDKLEKLTVPRAAHADFAGACKYADTDIRNMLERASARNTAQYVAVGAVCKQFLAEFGIEIISHVTALGAVSCQREDYTVDELKDALKGRKVGCADAKKDAAMVAAIEKAGKAGDTLGGVIEVIAEGVPVGLGTFMHWERRLDARISAAMMGSPAIKGVEIGAGFEYAAKPGSLMHDELCYTKADGFYHETNNAGGIEGGISNGETIVVRAAMKPIPTLMEPLDSVDLVKKTAAKAPKVRSDVTAVTAAGVVAEAMLAYVLTDAFLEKFTGDTLVDIKKNFASYHARLAK